jgi:hypothetical protein
MSFTPRQLAEASTNAANIALASAVTYLVWYRQRPVLEGLRIQNKRLEAVAAELKECARRAESAQQSAEQQLASLRVELKLRAATALDQVLGASRANIVASAADSYLRQNMDDLGAGDRIVGFVWSPKSDGTHSL